jgi:hypothetical protein
VNRGPMLTIRPWDARDGDPATPDLVLGGGGLLGDAWMTGVLAGYATGADVRRWLRFAHPVELDCGRVPQVEMPLQTHAAVSRFLAGG